MRLMVLCINYGDAALFSPSMIILFDVIQLLIRLFFCIICGVMVLVLSIAIF